MILDNQEIRKLSDYVLLNACAVSASGLYNGKAGISLSLFEASRHLEDETLEDHAFELLKEALLIYNEDIGFENGLSGIGYALIHLIDNEFIDADFEDFFGKQTDKVLDRLMEQKYNSTFLLQHITTVHFLSRLKSRSQDKRVAEMLDLLIDELERMLSFHFFHYRNPYFKAVKWETIQLFNLYLQLSFETNHLVSDSLIEVYKKLCNDGRYIHLYETGFYLSKLDKSVDVKTFAEQCKSISVQNLNPSLLCMRDIINLLSKMRQDSINRDQEIQILESHLVNNQPSDIEKSLLSTISKQTFQAGYGYGIARLISYASNTLNII